MSSFDLTERSATSGTEEGRFTRSSSPERGTSEPRSFEDSARSGGKRADALISSGDSKTGSGSRGKDRKRQPAEINPSIRLIFKCCCEAAERALQNPDDLVERVNALHELRDALADLWKYRNDRELQFGDLVNHLQFLLVDVDDLPPSQIEAVRRVIEKASYTQVLTDPDLREYTTILMRAGCDVFRELE